MTDKEKREEQQAAEIFLQFTEESKNDFINQDWTTEQTSFSQKIFKFISSHDVTYQSEEDDELNELVADFKYHWAYSDSAANKAAENVFETENEMI